MDDFQFIPTTPANTLQPVTAAANDIEIDNYDIVLINGPARKFQDVIKILLTSQGANLVYAYYGTALSNAPGTRGPSSLNSLIQNSVSQAFAWLQGQEESTDPSERIANINQLSVSPGSTPLEIVVNIAWSLENGQTGGTSFPVSAS